MNVLIVKLSAIGDVIHALPVSRAIKQTFPESRITWIVERPASDLLTENPDIDELIIFEKAKFKTVRGFLHNLPVLHSELRSKDFDIVLDLQGLAKSAIVAWISGARKRLGYCNMRELSGLISPPVCGLHQYGHVVERYLDVARALGCQIKHPEWVINPSVEDKATVNRIFQAEGLSLQDKYIVIAPGTNWQSKCWPTRSYAELVLLVQKNLRLPIVVVGAAKDKELVNKIRAESGVQVHDLTGQTTLKQLAFTLQKAMLFVGGDTGPMHLAVAMGCPVIALFGPTDHVRNGPYGNENILLRAGVECAPCFKKSCPDVHCMRKISPQEVYQAVLKITSCS